MNPVSTPAQPLWSQGLRLAEVVKGRCRHRFGRLQRPRQQLMRISTFLLADELAEAPVSYYLTLPLKQNWGEESQERAGETSSGWTVVVALKDQSLPLFVPPAHPPVSIVYPAMIPDHCRSSCQIVPHHPPG